MGPKDAISGHVSQFPARFRVLSGEVNNVLSHTFINFCHYYSRSITDWWLWFSSGL